MGIHGKLYEKNLAKVKDTDIYYCDVLKRVMGSDEVVMQNGLLKTIKDNFSVSIRTVKQWYIDLAKKRLTEYGYEMPSKFSLF